MSFPAGLNLLGLAAVFAACVLIPPLFFLLPAVAVGYLLNSVVRGE